MTDARRSCGAVGANGPRFGRCSRCGWFVQMGRLTTYKNEPPRCWPSCEHANPDGEAFSDFDEAEEDALEEASYGSGAPIADLSTDSDNEAGEASDC